MQPAHFLPQEPSPEADQAQENGYEAWQRLLREMQPVTRARSLALLTQLSRVQFAEGKSISEQLPLYESIVNEYERISGHDYADDAKVASILQAVPAHLRAHLQLWITDSITYEQLKNKVMELEALATRWDSSNSLSLPTRLGMDEAVPMEVDYIRGDKGKKGGKSKSKDKGKFKGKEKGKGKSEGKGSWKSGDKGKNVREKGGFGKKGKSQEKGKAGKATGACHNCGKLRHYAKECWSSKRVAPVEETSGGASSSTGRQGPPAVTTTSAVKTVRLQTPPDSHSLEIFDLTGSGSGSEDVVHPWRVGMVRTAYESEDELESCKSEFEDCIEPVVDIPEGISIVAMDLQDEAEERLVQMVRMDQNDTEECLVTLDSGADISVLPKSYGNVGQWAPGAESLKMVDAQGKQIAHDGVTRARLRTRDANGKNVEMVEEFVLGNVKHPILCAGRLLRKGWCIENEGGSLTLQHKERSVVVPISD